MHAGEWVQRALDHIEKNNKSYNQARKIYGFLTLCKDELPHVPLYYSLDSLANILHTVTPSITNVR